MDPMREYGEPKVTLTGNWLELYLTPDIRSMVSYVRMNAILSFAVEQQNIDDGSGHVFARVAFRFTEEPTLQRLLISQLDLPRLLAS